jgi:hypothetical protein
VKYVLLVMNARIKKVPKIVSQEVSLDLALESALNVLQATIVLIGVLLMLFVVHQELFQLRVKPIVHFVKQEQHVDQE